MDEPQWFRRRPVRVQAIEWTGDNEEAVQRFTCRECFNALDEADRANCGDPEATAQVFSRWSWQLVFTSQWIMRGGDGELRSVGADVLAATYDREE